MKLNCTIFSALVFSFSMVQAGQEVLTSGARPPAYVQKSPAGRPFAIYGTHGWTFNLKGSEKACRDLLAEYSNANGLNWLRANASTDDVYYVFVTDCDDTVSGQRSVTSSA